NLNFYSRNIDIQKEIIAPLMMHPTNYANGYYKECSLLADKMRNNHVFFAGSVQQKNYNSPLLKLIHNTSSRYKLVEFLKKNITDIKIPNNRNELNAFINCKNSNVIIADRAKAPIYPHEWLEKLSNTSFFIALPGTTIPFCHNIIEAMSIGVIPILSLPYANHMPQGLKDGINCLIYESEKNLIQKIKYARSLHEKKIFVMRKEVKKYYKDVLDFKGFGQLLIDKQPKQIYANAEFFSLQLLDKELNTKYTQEHPNA
ncbi:hypothetical protein N8475_10385, partial [Winogradskyella sp.]|nr:hypothetical protein [Winogradskyella sp.]